VRSISIYVLVSTVRPVLGNEYGQRISSGKFLHNENSVSSNQSFSITHSYLKYTGQHASPGNAVLFTEISLG
jgi:hypothetical protein